MSESDNTTTGYEVDVDDLRALVSNMLADMLDGITDPLIRYNELTKAQVLHDALVSEIKRYRGVEMRAMGNAAEAADPPITLARLAELCGLGSKQRVHQLMSLPPPITADQEPASTVSIA